MNPASVLHGIMVASHSCTIERRATMQSEVKPVQPIVYSRTMLRT